MAIIQISKIQQRSGNLVDLPQLDEAQFGWANDYKRLFIGATGNATTDVENVEVLTSYSTISFSQVEGSNGSNVNITNVLPGQILGYDANTGSWVNTGGNTDVPNDPGAGIPIHLGTVSNVKIAGGATGYILETDGAGNLSWSSKGTLRTSIIALSNTTPIVMNVANSTPYTNGLGITITGVTATNSSILNGLNFYVKVSNNFNTSGNVTLYSDPGLTTPVNGSTLGTYTPNSGVATASLSGGSSSTPGGGNTQIQFNDSGILNGSANFVITGGNNVSLTGNFSASNVAGGNLVSATYLSGTLVTAAQPNITSTGTLASLSVTGNANVGNIGATGVVATTLAGSLTTASQSNITSIGTLTILSVSGNANIGNIGTSGLITATGNISGANITTVGIVSATGNITGNFFIGNGSQLTGITVAAGSSIVNGNSNVTVTANSNVTISAVGTSNVVVISNTGATITGTISASGNANIGNLGVNGIFATTLSSTGNANLANIGTSGLITATGNVTGGNLITAGLLTATGNISGGNLVTVGVVSATGNILAGNVYANAGIIKAQYLQGDGSGITGISVGAGSQIINGNSNVTVVANSNVTISANGTSNVVVISNTGATITGTLSASGNVTGANVTTTKYLINSIQSSISAAGSTQGTGTALANTVNIITTVSSGAGVVLPTAVPGMTVYITNTSANSLLVYPASGATINELATNTALTQVTKSTIHYVAASSTQWYSVGATYA